MVIVSDYKLKEIMSQHLKNHADMGSVHATDLKIVQEHHGALAQFIVGVRVTHALQELDLVERGFGVLCKIADRRVCALLSTTNLTI